uniref:Uncharacterized protein n=1 Tax=Prumnopitys andina TaxID=120634 RepID=A0A3S5IBX3_9CONI|nr:hypothetical protein RF2 [Prumnopitys andina]BBF91231.1 hypothetical protein [Prumnopitys andina]
MKLSKKELWKNFRIEFPHRFRLRMMQLFNPWNRSYLTESYLFRWLTRIFSGRERLIKLLHFRILITLFLRDLRSFGVNQTIKVVILLTVPVFMYRVNFHLNEKKHMVFIAPNFTKNLLMVPHLFVSLSKYDTNLLNNKNGIISENQGPKSWETSSKSEDSPISWNLFQIFSNTLSIYESYMRTVATKKSHQSFELWKRPQDDHPFQHFMKLERMRKVDFWKTRTYLLKYPSSICVSSLDPGWTIFRKNRADLNHLNCIRFMNRSSPWNISSSVCDKNKEQWKRMVLEIIDQFSLSMTKSHRVDDNQIALDIDYYMINPFYELNESRLLNQIFNRRGKLKDQFLLSLLNIIDKDNIVVDEIRKEKDRAESLAQLRFHQYKMKVYGHFSKAKYAFTFQKVFKKYNVIENEFILYLRFYLRSGRNLLWTLLNIIDKDNIVVDELRMKKYRAELILERAESLAQLILNSKEKTLSNWIKKESLNNVMENAINQHSSTWRKVHKKWVDRSILRIGKYINRNFIVYNWSIQTEYLKNGFKQFVSSSSFSHNYVKLKNRLFDTNEYRVLVPRDIHLALKGFIEFFLFKNLFIDFDFFDKKLLISIHFPNLLSNWWSKFRSKFNINYIVGHKSVIIDFFMKDEESYDTPEKLKWRALALEGYESLFDELIKLAINLNEWFGPLFNKLLKLIQSIVVRIVDESQRLDIIDEGTISQSVLNEIPINQSIWSLFDNQKDGMECFDNTDLWARLNDRNWLNPLKQSSSSSLRASFEKANTIEFFDYLHHPRLNYNKRLSPYMEKIHIKNNNLTYRQLFYLFPIHNNLFPLPIDGINPVFLKKEIIPLIRSQVANILLAKYLGDRTLIYDSYKSLNLLTQLNYFVHDKRAISSIEEISTIPFTREQQIVVDFEKNSCPPFLNSSYSKENNVSWYNSDSGQDIDLIKSQSYAEDLRFIFETLFMKMNNIEINRKFVKDSTSIESSKDTIEKKAIYLTSPWWKCLEDVLLDTFMEIKKSTLLNKDKEILSRVFQFQINSSKWEFFETYRLCILTSAWWKYFEDIFFYPLLQILITSRDQFASILDLIQYKNEFLIHILDIFNILWALPHKLLAILEWKLKKNLEKFFNYVFNYVSYYFFKFSSNVSYYVSKIYSYVSHYYYKYIHKYTSPYVSRIYNYCSRSKRWRNWYFSLLSLVRFFKGEKEDQKQELEMSEIEIRDLGRKIPFTLFDQITLIPPHPSRKLTFKEMKMKERFKMMERFITDVKNGLIKNEKSLVLSVFSLTIWYFLFCLFLFPVHILNVTKDFSFWKDRVDDPEAFEELYGKFQTLQEPMPEIILGWFIDYEDLRIPIKGIYNYFIRKWSYTLELKWKTSIFPIYTEVLNCSKIDQNTSRKLAHFLIKEKSLSQLELKLLTNPKDFTFKWISPVTTDPNMPIAGYINEQPGLNYLRYLAEICQEGLINSTNKFDQFGSAERSVFLAFYNKITSSQKYRWDNLSSSRLKPFSLDLGRSSSYFSKRILLIGPMETGRSYLVKSLATDSYIPLIKISLRYFLPQRNDWKYELYEEAEDPMLYVPSIFEDTVENKLERKDIDDVRILRKHLVFKRIQQFILALELAKAMSPCVIWIPNIHELYFESYFLGILVERLFKENFPGIVIASTHLPKKVDPATIGSDGLDRTIHIRMLPFSQRQREFAILCRSKGVDLEKELSCLDEFGFRTKGFDARDLAALTNEVFLISLQEERSVIDTNTFRLAFNRNTRGLAGFDVQEYERLPYKVGKAFIQHTFRSMDPLFADQDFWSKRSFYLSHWYLEPSIAGASIKELTIFCHILGCLAGSAAQDSWFISERNRENWRPIDKFIKNDFALASSLLESFLIEFSLGISRSKSKFDQSIILTFAGQDIVTNHFNMMQKGISYYVNKKILKKENKFFRDHEDQDDSKFLNHIVWAPRTWRLSFLRSNQFDSITRSNQFVELLQDYEDFSDFKSMEKKIDSPYGRPDQKDRILQKWSSEMKAMLKERRIILGEEAFDIDYLMQYQSSNQSIFFLERFIWNPTSFLFQEKRINLCPRRELFINEEMLKRIYITYIPKRREVAKNPFKHRRVFGVYNENRILKMKKWKLQDIIPGDHMVSFQRIQAYVTEWRHISPYNPSSTYSRWLVEFSPMFDRLEFSVDRQRGNNRCLSESFIHNFLFESYQYLVNMFLSNKILLNKMTKTLLKNKILYPNEIVHLIAEERNRNKRD